MVPVLGDCEDGEFGGMKIGRGTEVRRENLPSTTLSTTNPTWPDPGANPSRRGGKPATNRLSYGAALTTELPYKPEYKMTLYFSIEKPIFFYRMNMLFSCKVCYETGNITYSLLL
jgi:hypothetical protein